MSTPHGRRLAASAAVAAAALGLAACGGGTSSSTSHPGNAVLDAYQTTVKAKTAKLSFVFQSSSAGAVVTLRGGGVSNLANGDSDLTMSVPNVGTLQLRYIAPEAYLKLPPALAGELGSGKPWVGMDLSSLVPSAGAGVPGMSAGTASPAQTLSYLQAASSSGVTKVGTAKVGGVSTTAYRLTINLDKALDRITDKAARASAQALLQKSGVKSVPTEVWVDAQGRIRQLVLHLSLTEAGQHVTVSETVDLSDFGVAVNVAAPPASQVGRLSAGGS